MRNRTSVPAKSRTTLDAVEGDLVVGEHAVIDGTGTPPTVKVSGTIYCEGDNTFKCNLSAENLESEDEVVIDGDLEVGNNVEIEDGCLEVHGKMTAKRIDVNAAIRVKKDLAVEEVDVGGSTQVDGNLTAGNVDVGGSMKVDGAATAKNVDVGGSVSIQSRVNITELSVGGTAKVASDFNVTAFGRTCYLHFASCFDLFVFQVSLNFK